MADRISGVVLHQCKQFSVSPQQQFCKRRSPQMFLQNKRLPLRKTAHAMGRRDAGDQQNGSVALIKYAQKRQTLQGIRRDG